MELGVRINLLLYFVVFVAMLFLNIVIPYTADDFTYGYASNGILMSIKFAWLQYHIWDGRLVTSVITSYLLQRGGEILYFNIINALCFVIFIFQIQKVSEINKSKFSYIFICLGFASVVFIDFGEVALWKTASIQYLWGVVLYIYIFNKYIIEVNAKIGISSKINFPDLFIFFISSFWLQNINIIFIIFMFMRALINRYNLRYYAYITIYLIGSLISLLAPGNLARKKFVYEQQTSPEDYILIHKLLHFHHDLILNSGGFILSYLFLFCLSFFVIKIKREILRRSNIFFIFGFLINYIMILFPAGVWTTRTWFAGNVFMLISSLILFNSILRKFKISNIIITMLAILGCVLFSYKYITAYNFYNNRTKQTDLFISYLKQNGCDANKVSKAGELFGLSVINNSWLFNFTPNYQPKHLCGYIDNKYYGNLK